MSQLMARRRTRLHLLLLAALVAACAGVAASSAQAVTYVPVYYCEILVAPYSACPDTPGRALWDQNNAQYTGSGTVGVCQKALLDDGSVATRTCADDYVNAGGALGPYYNSGVAVTPYVGNNSQWNHTITGYADYVSGGPHIATGASTASATSSTSSTTTSDPAMAPAVSASTLPASVRASLGVLRSGTQSADGTYATLKADGDGVFLKPTADRICLGSSLVGGVLTCQRQAETAAGALVGAVICGRGLPADDVVIYGVVPDGVATVRAVRGDATVQSATVTQNTYRVELTKEQAAGVDRIAWTTDSGAAGGIGDVLPPDLGCRG